MNKLTNTVAALLAAWALVQCGQAVNHTPTPPAGPTAAPSEFWQPTETAVAAPSASPTSSIQQVTAAPTPSLTPSPAIIEVGTPMGATLPPPGIIIAEAGTYSPRADQPVYMCPDLNCQTLPNHKMAAGSVHVTVGWVVAVGNQIWLCEHILDDGRAQICDQAILWVSPGKIWGKYLITK